MGILNTDWKFLNMLALQFLDNSNTQYNSVYLVCTIVFIIYLSFELEILLRVYEENIW